MAKVIDITDKLSFDGNPSLKIREELVEVTADAPTVLKMMGLVGSDDPGVEEIISAYELIFPEESKKKIEKLKLGFQDLVTLIQTAITLIVGEETSQGEQ